MTDSLEGSVAVHYGRKDLTETILGALEASGADIETLSIEALGPVDEFHTAGKAATSELFGMMPLRPDMHILDIGCGIGGTARTLASGYGCSVSGIDLTPEFIETAKALTTRTGLAGQCSFQVASALNLPFEDGTFDGAITLHVAMNIEDRDTLYTEAARVLRPGGAFGIFDVMKGPTSGMTYPVPWAETEETSFLKSRDKTANHLDRAGFDITAEKNLLEFAIEFFEANAKRAAEGGPPHIGLHLLMGDSAPQKFANYLQAAKAHQIEPLILICEKRTS